MATRVKSAAPAVLLPAVRASDETTLDEVQATLEDAIYSGSTVILPYGLVPAEPVEPVVSKPIDLGEDDPKYKGYVIIVDLDMEIEAQAMIAKVTNPKATDSERLEATYRFLEMTLVAWNFTEKVNGQTQLLPQPREGGVRRLRSSQLTPIINAVSRAVKPDPNL